MFLLRFMMSFTIKITVDTNGKSKVFIKLRSVMQKIHESYNTLQCQNRSYKAICFFGSLCFIIRNTPRICIGYTDEKILYSVTEIKISYLFPSTVTSQGGSEVKMWVEKHFLICYNVSYHNVCNFVL